MVMDSCPKCKSTRIDKGTLTDTYYRSKKQEFITLAMGGKLNTYVCRNCGYLESYVDLGYLKDKLKEE